MGVARRQVTGHTVGFANKLYQPLLITRLERYPLQLPLHTGRPIHTTIIMMQHTEVGVVAHVTYQTPFVR